MDNELVNDSSLSTKEKGQIINKYTYTSNGKPQISIIIPIYNVEEFLPQCLDSIVNQTYHNLEIILIDDGSSDNCGVICDKYAEKDERIVVIHKENGGVNTARNIGIQKATGEWIAFVDSDDWCELDYYEKMIDSTSLYNVDVLYAGGYYVDYPKKSIMVHTFKEGFQISERKDIDNLRIKVLMPGKHCNAAYGFPFDKLYKSSFMRQNHLLFDTSLKAWDDMWSNFIFFADAKVIAVNMAIGYHYRQVTSSITKGFNPQKPKIMYQTISMLHSYASQNELSDEMVEAIEETAIPAILTTLSCYYFHPSNHQAYRDIACQIKEMKTWPLFRKGIWGRKNQFLPKKLMILKYLLRIPWIFPLKVVFKGNEILRSAKNRNLSSTT